MGWLDPMERGSSLYISMQLSLGFIMWTGMYLTVKYDVIGKILKLFEKPISIPPSESTTSPIICFLFADQCQNSINLKANLYPTVDWFRKVYPGITIRYCGESICKSLLGYLNACCHLLLIPRPTWNRMIVNPEMPIGSHDGIQSMG